VKQAKDEVRLVPFALGAGVVFAAIVLSLLVVSQMAEEPAPVPESARIAAPEAQPVDEYAWVDRERGLVRIPIQRAMEIVAERESQR
jgi:hypothetical protein